MCVASSSRDFHEANSIASTGWFGEGLVGVRGCMLDEEGCLEPGEWVRCGQVIGYTTRFRGGTSSSTLLTTNRPASSQGDKDGQTPTVRPHTHNVSVTSSAFETQSGELVQQRLPERLKRVCGSRLADGSYCAAQSNDAFLLFDAL